MKRAILPMPCIAKFVSRCICQVHGLALKRCDGETTELKKFPVVTHFLDYKGFSR